MTKWIQGFNLSISAFTDVFLQHFLKNDQVFVVQVDLKWIFKLLLFKSSFALPLTIVLMPCNSFSEE